MLTNEDRPDYLAPETEIVVTADYDEIRGMHGKIISDHFGYCTVRFQHAGTRTFGRQAIEPVVTVHPVPEAEAA